MSKSQKDILLFIGIVVLVIIAIVGLASMTAAEESRPAHNNVKVMNADNTVEIVPLRTAEYLAEGDTIMVPALGEEQYKRVVVVKTLYIEGEEE